MEYKNFSVWKFENGVLVLEIPAKLAYFEICQDRQFTAVRGNLSLQDFLNYMDKFLSVYKKML